MLAFVQQTFAIIVRIVNNANYKTKKFGKTLRLPLTERAKQFLDKEFDKKLIETFTNQYHNRVLKKIAALLGIEKKLTTQVARHSFATIWIEQGHDVGMLNKLLAHSSYNMTLRYVKARGYRMKDPVDAFQKAFD